MKKLIVSIAALVLIGGVTAVEAQDRIPREYSNPDELISLDRQTPFPEAIDVLNIYAQDFENRFIIDQSGYTGNINVSLPTMHWRDALDYILRVQNLVALESQDVYEIVTEERARRLSEPETRETERARQEELEITTSTREVRINATFFEGSRRALREIGVDWSTLTNVQNIPENIVQFVDPDQGGGGVQGSMPTTQFDGSFVNVNARGAQNVSQNVFNSLINFGDVGGGIEVQALFSAFEADNLGKILATPSIKVLNGEEGRIQVGQDFSIKQRDFAGNVTDQFFSTGTILRVTPHIVQVGDTTLIYMDLEAERSTAQPDPVSTIINKQQANTHALLLDGESTVIAGLYRTEENQVRRGIPFLKDLPGWFFGLKYLFGYNSTDVVENELIVLLQAELEKPLSVRAGRAFDSQRQLLEREQEIHRTRLDGLHPDTPASSLESITDTDPVETDRGNRDVPETDTGTEDEARAEREWQEEQRRIQLEREIEQERETERRRAAEREAERERELERERERREAAERERELEREREQREAVEREQEQERTAAETLRQQTREIGNEITHISGDGDIENLSYFIIGRSLTSRDNAEREYQRFSNENYDVHLLYVERTGFYFVAYAGFTDYQEAIRYLRNIQQNVQRDAWLLQSSQGSN